jgi:hypothetical protein
MPASNTGGHHPSELMYGPEIQSYAQELIGFHEGIDDRQLRVLAVAAEDSSANLDRLLQLSYQLSHQALRRKAGYDNPTDIVDGPATIQEVIAELPKLPQIISQNEPHSKTTQPSRAHSHYRRYWPW